MQFMTRGIGETLMIGDKVSVTVLGLEALYARLGIEAPADIEIYREECGSSRQERVETAARAGVPSDRKMAGPQGSDD